jgi:predicted NUDIX family NTP pyrophosphohydrolase
VVLPGLSRGSQEGSGGIGPRDGGRGDTGLETVMASTTGRPTSKAARRGKLSAGILPFRTLADGAIAVLLVHPGGPFWARKDMGSWSLAKGEAEAREAGTPLLEVARREFHEETGFVAEGPFLPLGALTQPGGKVVHAWAVRGAWDPAQLTSNTFVMEWPRGSGRMRTFPEVDRAAWFDVATARTKLLRGQTAFLDRLLQVLAGT